MTALEVAEFLNTYPLPPRLEKGDRRGFSLNLSSAEYEMLQELAHHPNARHSYGGQLGAVMRHAFYWFIQEALAFMDAGEKPPVIKLLEHIDAENRLVSKEAIFELLDTTASRLNLALDIGEDELALAEYDEFLDRVASQKRIAPMIYYYLGDHPEFERFRQRVIDKDPLRILDLQNIEEKPRG